MIRMRNLLTHKLWSKQKSKIWTECRMIMKGSGLEVSEHSRTSSNWYRATRKSWSSKWGSRRRSTIAWQIFRSSESSLRDRAPVQELICWTLGVKYQNKVLLLRKRSNCNYLTDQTNSWLSAHSPSPRTAWKTPSDACKKSGNKWGHRTGSVRFVRTD